MLNRSSLSLLLSLLAILAGAPSCAVAASPAVISIETKSPLALPPRSNFAGANMQLFFTGSNYRDPNLQSIVKPLHLGWTRFPGGTVDDVYDWKTGDMRDDWIAQFKGVKAFSYSEFVKDIEIIRGKGLIKTDDYAAFLHTQRMGEGPGAGPTHTIGVINTFTDTPESAAALVVEAEKKNLHVDVWELGNEPSYFEKFYPSATAYLDKVALFAAAMRKADPNVRVAVYFDRREDWMRNLATYPHRYWDALYMHAYPDPPKDADGPKQFAFYNGFLQNLTNRFIDDTVVSLFGKKTQMEVSEFNIGAMRGGMFAAMFIAEYTIRMSSDPHVLRVGMHAVVGQPNSKDACILPSKDYIDEAVAAARAGKVIDTTHKDYGYYYTPSGLALQIIDGVINTSAGLWPTKVAGGTAVPTAPIGKIGTAGNIPAIYAQAYRTGDATMHLLLTNKSANPQPAKILVNGKSPQTVFSTISVGDADPMAKNTAISPDAVRIHRDTTSEIVTVPPYGVMDVSWQQ